MVNAGRDIAVAGGPDGRAWRVGIRHPGRPDALCALVAVTGSVATSGDYERPGQLLDPATGRRTRAAVSATVTGPTSTSSMRWPPASPSRAALCEAHLVTETGRHLATPGMAFVSA